MTHAFIERRDIVINASFTATVNVSLEVGALQETITVSGESPTVDVKSNLQQTVMSQEILEGIPTGRDPWSLAQVIPGVQVSTYDVGGNQAMRQSSLRVHGARDEDNHVGSAYLRPTDILAPRIVRFGVTVDF
jgi:hypothetical protein